MEDKNLWWYEKTYSDLVDKARKRGLDKSKLDGYFEKHHIVPKSVGGSDEDSNFVLLTYREHIVAHRLLIRLYPGSRGLNLALYFLVTPKKNRPKEANDASRKALSTRELEEIKLQSVEYLREVHTGLKASDETKKLLSEIRMGHEVRPETREKLSKAHLDKVMSDEHKKNLSKAHRGRKLSESARKAISGGNSVSAKTVVDPEGRVFSTLNECAEFYKTTVTTLKKRIEKSDSGFIVQDKNPNKLVLNEDTGVVYKSIKSCAKAINRSNKFVSNICKGVSNNTSFNLCFVNEDYCKTNNISPV